MHVSLWHATFRKLRNLQLFMSSNFFPEFKSVVRKMYKYTKVHLRLCYSLKEGRVGQSV
jgi:hypothetical protein